jgi:hypothetical protein
MLELMFTSGYAGLNRLNFIRKHFLQISCEMFLMYAVIAVFKSLIVLGRSRYTVDFAALVEQEPASEGAISL